MKQKRTVYYGTIQIRDVVKRHIVDYCDQRGLKIGRFIEMAVLYYISGSSSGSVMFR